MSVPVHSINPQGIIELINKKIVSGYREGGAIVVARYGVNKTTLKKLLKKEKA